VENGKGEFDPPLFVEVLEVERDELRPIVSDDIFGDAETADDVLPDQVFGFSIEDLMVCLSLYPLGVVCDCEHVHALAGCCRKLSHNVHSPLHEGPWREDGSELFG